MEHEPVAKRKRCGPSLFPTTPPGTSPRVDAAGSGFRGLSHYGSPLSSRSVKRAKRKLDVDEQCGSTSINNVSPFLSATPPLPTGKRY